MNKITMDKKYKTRGGQEVRVLCVDRDSSKYPVVALIGCEPVGLTEYGEYLQGWENFTLDLIEIKPRFKQSVWLNIYPDGEHCSYTDRGEANRNAAHIRLACIRVEIDCEEGEGLNE